MPDGVIPAKAEIHFDFALGNASAIAKMDPGLRWDDEQRR